MSCTMGRKLQGQIIPKEANVWEIRFQTKRKTVGRRSLSELFAGTFEQAEERRDELLQLIAAAKNAPEIRTVEELLKTWIEREVVPTCERKTVEDYENQFRRYIYPRLGSKLAAEVKKADVEQLFADMRAGRVKVGKKEPKKLSAQVVRKTYFPANAGFKWGVKHKYVPENPFAGIKVPRRKKKEWRIPTPDEWTMIWNAGRSVAEKTLFMFAGLTGARPGEFLAVRWRDLEGQRLVFAAPWLNITTALLNIKHLNPINLFDKFRGKRVG